MRITCFALFDPTLSFFRRQRFSHAVLPPLIEVETRYEHRAHRCSTQGGGGTLEVPTIRRRVLEDLPNDQASAISDRHVDPDGSSTLVVAGVAVQHPHVVEAEHHLRNDQH
jgi:hypothetical protein